MVARAGRGPRRVRATRAGTRGREKLAGTLATRRGEGKRHYGSRGIRRSIRATVPAAAVGWACPRPHPLGVGVTRPRRLTSWATPHSTHISIFPRPHHPSSP